MTQKPHRPFVPERAPNASAKATGSAQFRLPRPFVHGVVPKARPTAQRSSIGDVPPDAPSGRPAPPPLPLVYDAPPSVATSLNATIQFFAGEASATRDVVAEPESLAPIEQFLETASPYLRDASDFDDSYELPPVEHFMDSLPEGAAASVGNGEPITHITARQEIDLESEAAQWGDTDWQHYDWRSAAALGDSADPEASSAWSETDWENAPPPAREIRETAAKAIADALDGIARRIRNGELVIPSPGSVADPMAIAATLAALLGVRR